jgi:anti-anti-sigma factor
VDLSESVVGGVRVLDVRGRIDSTNAFALGERLTQALGPRESRLVLDLAQLEYMSSAGFRVLLLAAKRAEETGSRFVLCGISGKLRQLFDLGGFLDLFPTCASREDAIRAV